MSNKILQQSLITSLAIVICVSLASAQQNRASLRGLITDEMGAAIVGAAVSLTNAGGQSASTVTGNDGTYVFSNLAAGKYIMRAAAKGFGPSTGDEIEIKPGQRQTFDLQLKVTIEEQKVTIAGEVPISTDASANANQTVISGKDLDALPDDPDELAAALQALAGPSMGPNGGQIFIDGFSGGALPSKSSIREIRINQNPFAAENDQPSGRIDVFTKPGTDKLRGTAFMNFNDESLNSRNPFTNTLKRAPFQVRQYGGNLSGPLVKNKASYFIDFERREINDNELVTATILDSNLNPTFVGRGIVTPRRFINFSPRVDYALNSSNTLVIRYSYNHSNLQNNGVGNFSLPERAYTAINTSQNLQLTETAILNPTTINETRFQFTRSRNENLGDSSTSALVVSGSFIGGSSQVGRFQNTDQRWELGNFTAIQKGQHAYKIGGRLRGVHIDNVNPANFGGQYVFTGAVVPQLDGNGDPIPNAAPIPVNSLERYRRNQLLYPRTLLPTNDPRYLSATDLRARGGGASQYSVNTGNPEASVSQFDFSIYGQDDWRIRPNLTVSYGLRYEYQTNIHSPLNFAPRLAFAWSPGAANSARPPKMVIRAGFGVFYNRFGENQTLQAIRFDGFREQQYLIREAPLYTTDVNGNLVFVPPVSTALDAFPASPSLAGVGPSRQITYRVAPDLRAPAVYGGGVQVERQLPYRFTMFAGVFVLQIQHVIRTRDINAPLPGSITSANPNGIRPYGNTGDIYQIESSGRFNQRQFFVGFNNRFSRAISFFGNFSISNTKNDTDGQGSRSFPVNSYDLRGEYGRGGFDIRRRFAFGGTWTLPYWGLSLNPFILASTGAPFNIITGADTNGDGQFSERPSFAPDGACSSPSRPVNIICTPFGNFNLNPGVGEKFIPRNYGQSPGYFVVNLTANKTWTFGTIHSGKSAAASKAAPKTTNTNASAKPAAAGAGIPGLGAGGLGGGASKEAKRYTMQFSISVQNVFNRANLQPLEGNLSSPSFGQSLGLNGFGGFGSPGSAGAGNRRIIGRIRFTF